MDEVETVPDNEFDVVWGARQWVLCVFNMLLGQWSYGYSSQQAAQLPALVYSYVGPIASATVSGAGWWNRANVGSAEFGLLWFETVCAQLHTMTVVPPGPSEMVHLVCGSLQVGLVEAEMWNISLPSDQGMNWTDSQYLWLELNLRKTQKYTSKAQMILEQRDLSLN